MNDPSMIKMASSNSLIVKFSGNKLNEGDISSVYFGSIESAMRSMIGEINILTAASTRKIYLTCCCCLSFGCLPCLLCCALPKLNEEWKNNVRNIISKNDHILESNGFKCNFVQVIDRKTQNTYLEFKKKI